MSLYTQQLAALDKRRGKGQQKMTVEYDNVEAGGQAIVGNVNTDAKARPAHDEAATMLSNDNSGDELSREALKPAKPTKRPAVRKRTR